MRQGGNGIRDRGRLRTYRSRATLLLRSKQFSELFPLFVGSIRDTGKSKLTDERLLKRSAAVASPDCLDTPAGAPCTPQGSCAFSHDAQQSHRTPHHLCSSVKDASSDSRKSSLLPREGKIDSMCMQPHGRAKALLLKFNHDICHCSS